MLGAVRVQLVLPDCAVDPASKFQVKLGLVEQKLAHLQAEITVRRLQVC
jgi:hypothetical protein